MFIDRAKIYVKAGDGGNGCISFRREKGIPRGGPSGGDGGRGGSIYVEASSSYRTLIDQKYQQHYKAEGGGHGQGKCMHGGEGPDLFIQVPCGTMVIDDKSGTVLADLTQEGQRVLVARGGKGGRGNAYFATPSRRAPRLAEKGERGEERTLLLELKIIAEVGLVGLPNSGKSTLLAAITSAHPKIGSYPFTTLSPNLGVVWLDEAHGRYLVVADIPGLIEGAAMGAGLGNQFLRHIERTRLLVQVIDVSKEASHEPVRAYHILRRELSSYHPGLMERPHLVVANKIDLPCDPNTSARLRDFCQGEGVPLFFISALRREGLGPLLSSFSSLLEVENQRGALQGGGKSG